jgi:hypothetical protein
VAGFVNSNAPDQLRWHVRLSCGKCFMNVGVSELPLFTAGFLTCFTDQTLDVGTCPASSSQVPVVGALGSDQGRRWRDQTYPLIKHSFFVFVD